MPEPRGDCDDEPHVGLGQLVQRVLVLLLFPRDGERMFLFPLKIGGLHRPFDELPPWS